MAAIIERHASRASLSGEEPEDGAVPASAALVKGLDPDARWQPQSQSSAQSQARGVLSTGVGASGEALSLAGWFSGSLVM
jgi:hypothetical protein